MYISRALGCFLRPQLSPCLPVLYFPLNFLGRLGVLMSDWTHFTILYQWGFRLVLLAWKIQLKLVYFENSWSI